MSVIGVNDGHTKSGAGSGAVGIISESEHTRLVGAEVRRLINERGHKAINCTVDKADSASQALALIVAQANRQDLDWFISIHFNAAGGRGVECYTYEGRQYEDAIEVCKNISDLGFVNRGVKSGTGLYVVRKTKAKSLLVEVCFVDSEDANHYLKIGHKVIAKAIVDALMGYIETPVIKPQPTPQPTPILKYQAQIQNIGWQKEVLANTDEFCGTVGQSLRLEALIVNLENTNGNVIVEGHIENRGWQSLRYNGEMVGTIGQSLRLECIKMHLEGVDGYKIQYRSHCENIGWTEWVENDAECGSTGKGLRIEAIQIRLVKA